jgi:sugar phosphate isomerase/epimerase
LRVAVTETLIASLILRAEFCHYSCPHAHIMLSNKLAIASLSLGQHPSHHLVHKIQAAADAGYKGIEIVYFELEAFSQAQNISILEGAERIRVLCQKLNLDVLSLAPFENYEGDRSPLSDRLQKARHWIGVARVLHAPYLQIPSNYKPDAIGDKDVVISELKQLADIGSAEQPVISIAYEYLSWGTHCSTWEVALQYVNDVNRPNFGLCLDTFHEATKLWGDPFAAAGRFPGSDNALRESLDRFVAGCPVEKIFFLQLSDGERFDPPFTEDHPWFVEGEAPQFTWSKHARPFPFEHDHGAYLPITEISEAWILAIGFEGWVSMEIFDRGMRDRSSQPETAAMRGIESWKTLRKELESVSKHRIAQEQKVSRITYSSRPKAAN